MDQTKEIYVWGDEFKIEEVLMNYFSNAVNHCEKEKVIEVKIEEMDGHARVSVFNTGMPIPEDSLPHLWEKFYKVDKANEGIRRKRYRTVDRQGNYGVDEPEIRRNQLRKRR